MSVIRCAEELTSNTPMLFLSRIAEKTHARIFAKLEFKNIAGSVKDRVALAMLLSAERSGRLKAGGTVIVPTSGNTGIGLAAIGAARGYRVVVVMPSSMSEERRRILRAYGAELVLTPKEEGMRGALSAAERLAAEREGSYLTAQFSDPANPAAHYAATGPEIWRDLGGEIGAFVAGVGTGGTLTGVGRFLKEKDPSVRVVAVEPSASPVLSGGEAGAHPLEGIGAGFVPETFDRSVCDAVERVSKEEAYAMCSLLARREGVLAGISSGAALAAALRIARAGENVVTVFPDSGERYLSRGIFG